MAIFEFVKAVLVQCLFVGVVCQLPPDDMEKIDTFMTELMECRGMPGSTISAVQNGETVISKGYGFANLETQAPVTEHTIFPIASCSKSFTSTLLGKLFADSGYSLNWDSVVSKVVDDVILFYNGYVTNHTKFRDSISHQTGLPINNAPWIMDTFSNRAESVERMAYFEPQYEFREEFLYNNWLYNIAMHPMEILSDQTWEQLLQNELLDPLQMMNSTFYDEAAPDYDGFVTGYVYGTYNDQPDELQPLPYEWWSGSRLIGPGGSVCSTASDIAKWMYFILNGGTTVEGTKLMNQSDITRLWYPEAAYNEVINNLTKPLLPVTDSVGSYGLAYWNGHYRGYKQNVVSGDLRGFHSDIFFLPDMGIGIFFATNFGGHFLDRRFVHMYIADVLLGYEPVFNAADVCELLNDPSSLSLYGLTEEELNTKNENIYGNLNADLDIQKWRSVTHEYEGMPKFIAKRLYEMKKEFESNSNHMERRRENYIGMYGNFAYGNLTVSESLECPPCLHMDYGQLGNFTLFPINETDSNVFWASNTNMHYDNIVVVFSDQDDGDSLYQAVTPIDFNYAARPKFIRDLKMDDAVPPNIDSC